MKMRLVVDSDGGGILDRHNKNGLMDCRSLGYWNSIKW